MSRRPCRLSRGPRVTTFVPPFGGAPAGEWLAVFSAWAISDSFSSSVDLSTTRINSSATILRRHPRPRVGGRVTALMDPDSTDEMVDDLVDFFYQVASDYDAWA